MGTGIKKKRWRLAAGIDEKYNQFAKTLLTNPLVQALVINHACTEFLGLSLKEVKKRIQRHRLRKRRVDVEAPVALEKTELWRSIYRQTRKTGQWIDRMRL